MPPVVARNAVSAASRPVAMRTIVDRGARHVASSTFQWPSTYASTTAWKSIGLRPGAYTDARRAGTSHARRNAITRWAKSRTDALPGEQRGDRAVDRAARSGHVSQPCSDPARHGDEEVVAGGPAKSARPAAERRSDSQYRLGPPVAHQVGWSVVRVRAGHRQRSGDRPLYGRRLARTRLRGALFPHLRGVGRGGRDDRLPVQPRRLRPGARHDGGHRARLRASRPPRSRCWSTASRGSASRAVAPAE